MIDEDNLRSIEKLHAMRAEGILSDEEFEDAKRKILNGQPSRARTTAPTAKLVHEPADTDYLAWASLPLRRYAQFTGRSGRKEFWLFLLAVNLVAAALAIVWTADTNFIGYTGTIGNMAFAILIIGFLAILVPYLAVQVRRFHDQDRSGWFALLNLIPYIGPFIVLVMMALPETEGANQYGPDPAEL